VPPGEHELRALSFFGDAVQKFRAAAGGLYFFKVASKGEDWVLEPMPEPEARGKLGGYRLSGDNAFESGGPVPR
jgi:hypothetical protein